MRTHVSPTIPTAPDALSRRSVSALSAAASASASASGTSSSWSRASADSSGSPRATTRSTHPQWVYASLVSLTDETATLRSLDDSRRLVHVDCGMLPVVSLAVTYCVWLNPGQQRVVAGRDPPLGLVRAARLSRGEDDFGAIRSPIGGGGNPQQQQQQKKTAAVFQSLRVQSGHDLSPREMGLSPRRERSLWDNFAAFAEVWRSAPPSASLAVWQEPVEDLVGVNERYARYGTALDDVSEVAVAVRCATLLARPWTGPPPRTAPVECLSRLPREALEEAFLKRRTIDYGEGQVWLSGVGVHSRTLERLAARDDATGAEWRDSLTNALVVDGDDAHAAALEARGLKVARRVHDWCDASDVVPGTQVWVGLMQMARWTGVPRAPSPPSPRARLVRLAELLGPVDLTGLPRRVCVMDDAPPAPVRLDILQSWLFTSSRPSLRPEFKSAQPWFQSRDIRRRTGPGVASPAVVPWRGAHAFDLVNLEKNIDVVVYRVTCDACDVDVWRCLEAAGRGLVVCGERAEELVRRAFTLT